MSNPPIRYGQCDETCTVDCGHCKGEGAPALDLDQIEARANAATPGPWDVGPYGTSFTSRHVGRIVLAPMIAPASFDAEFIAHAREDVPALVAEVRRLRQASEDWPPWCEHCGARCDGQHYVARLARAEAERDAARAEAVQWRENAENASSYRAAAESDRDEARAEAERQRERADHNAAAVNENADEIVRLRAELDRFKPQPMSQQCRDGRHGQTGDWRCYNCRCLCHTFEHSRAGHDPACESLQREYDRTMGDLAVAVAETGRVREALQAVRALHCECTTGNCACGGGPGWCHGCDGGWPCSTVRALDAALTGNGFEQR